MILPSPLTLYIAAGAVAIGAISGYKVRDWQCDAALANALERAQEQREEMQNEVDERARAYEALRTEADALGSRSTREIHTVYQEVPAAPAECEPDYRVVGLLQGSVRAANADASGQSGSAMPQPTPTTGTTTGPSEGDLGN
jgi:hypothetical protein